MNTVSTDDLDPNNTVDYQVLVEPNRRRLWVNASDGSAVARFNVRFGIDIHNSATDQLNGAPECLYCTHEQPSLADWDEFRARVKLLYGVVLAQDDIDVTLLRPREG